MSAATLAWAISCKVQQSSLKNLLMIVADLANHVDGKVFPSLAYLQETTGLSKRTVLAGLDELLNMGVLERTEERRGHTGQIPVYVFHMVDSIPRVQKPAVAERGAKTTPFRKEVQKRPERGAFSTPKEVQKRTTEPSSRNQVEESEKADSSSLPKKSSIDEDLFGEPIETAEQRKAREDDELVAHVEQRWKDLAGAHAMIPAINGISDVRRKAILARGAEATDQSPRALWDQAFEEIGRSRFLQGRATPTGDRDPMAVRFDWLLKPTNFAKVIEGNYRDRRTDHAAFDEATGRKLTPVEQGARNVAARLRESRDRVYGRGDQGGAAAAGPRLIGSRAPAGVRTTGPRG